MTFGDNETFTPKLRYKFTDQSASRVIDLLDELLKYTSTNRREGKGTVEVLGC